MAGRYIIAIKRAFDVVYLTNTPTAEKSRKLVSKFIKKIVASARAEFSNEIDSYHCERDAACKLKMEAIQRKVLGFLFSSLWFLSFIGKIIPSSSFSSDMFLAGESDLDFTITILKMDASKLDQVVKILTDNGYKFESEKCAGKPDHYYVYQKMIDGIEIEVKIRDHEPCVKIIKLHIFIDNSYSPEDKKPLTYLKKITKHDKEAYSKLKYLIYENALHESKWTGELFGCHVKHGIM